MLASGVANNYFQFFPRAEEANEKCGLFEEK